MEEQENKEAPEPVVEEEHDMNPPEAIPAPEPEPHIPTTEEHEAAVERGDVAVVQPPKPTPHPSIPSYYRIG